MKIKEVNIYFSFCKRHDKMTERPPKQAWINEEKTTAKDKVSTLKIS